MNLNDLLKPEWSVQKEVADLWNGITLDEQQIIASRMDDLFQNGLPFELKHEKIVYIHLFLTLAQVDIMACQIPLKFQSKIKIPEFEQRLRAQLLDEIFHVMLAVKIIYMLSAPYSCPPELNDNLQTFCEFIKKEDCPKTAVIFLNLITEGVGEELVHCFKRFGVASKVLDIIIKDERRHVSDADLYFAMGLPEIDVLQKKLNDFEDHVLSGLLQYNSSMAFLTALGIDGIQDFISKVDAKYTEQLSKLNLKPGNKWTILQQFLGKALHNFKHNSAQAYEVEMTPFRKYTMTHWSKPSDPTVVGQFNIDVSNLHFFEKKYPADTLTTLMLQTMSQVLVEHPECSLFLNDQKLFQRKQANVCLVVKLPDCGEHMGIISFQDCHKLPVSVLSAKIKQIIPMMVYCYKKREQLEREHPRLRAIQNNVINELSDTVFCPILPAIPGVCLSNIGASGYTQAKSPLLSHEAIKITIMAVQKTPVWCELTKAFVARDLLPVSMSADHRIFGAMPIPKIMERVYQEVFAKMVSNQSKADGMIAKATHFMETTFNDTFLVKKIDDLLAENVEFGYLALMIIQTMWPDFLSVEEVFGAIKSGSPMENLFA